MFNINSNYKIIIILFFCMATIANAKGGLDKQKLNKVNEVKGSNFRTVVQEAKLLPEPNLVGGEMSQYGSSVAIDGDRALVGAMTMAGHGLVFVLEFDGTDWLETDVLIPNDGQSEDRFGASVSLSGDRALIGADSDSDNGSHSGSAYIFDFSAGNWTQTAKLLADDGDIDDQFGSSVSVSGDVALVGALLDNASNLDSGSAYIFTRVAGNWSQTQKLIASDAGISDNFGGSVSLEGTRALIGAIHGGNNSSGAAYVFDFSGSWTETQLLTSVSGSFGDNFGQSVSLLGDRCLIGANGDDDLGSGSGAAYIYDLIGTWTLTQKLTANDGAAIDLFGTSVSLITDRVVIGAAGDDDTAVESGSAYIFDLNGTWTQTDKIVANDAEANDIFGSAVAISGDNVIIGVHADDDFGTNSGSAYIFKNNTSNWSQLSKHTGGDGAAFDGFSVALDIAGNWAIIGATADDEKALNAGSAYVFELQAGHWIFDSKLLASDGMAFDAFGSSISIFGNRVLIGASQDDEVGINSGSVYVFELDTGNWIEKQKLTPNDGAANHGFGASVSLQANRALISSPFGNGMVASAGSVYVFDESAGSFTQTTKLFANDGAGFAQFGVSVSLDNNRALIGAAQDAENGSGSGSAYVFDFDTNTWIQSAKLIASDGSSFDAFGSSVSLSGDRALIGAFGTDDSGFNSGSAYIFDLIGSTWTQMTELKDLNGESMDEFAISVSLSDTRALIGSHKDNSNGQNSGSAFVFELDAGIWSQIEFFSPVDGRSDDNFGNSTALDGNYLLIGAVKDDDNGTSSGSAYAYMFELPELIFAGGFE